LKPKQILLKYITKLQKPNPTDMQQLSLNFRILKSYFKKLSVLAIVLSMLTSCTVDEEMDRPLPLVTVGNQVWTTKNLEVTTYRDGTPIPEVTDPTDWENLTTGAWCYYENDTENGKVYGKIYNWYAVAGIHDQASKTDLTKRKQLAPAGYHIPNDFEWSTLINYLGGTCQAGNKMKETGIEQWLASNSSAANTSGFTALPGGYRDNDGSFSYVEDYGGWWSISEDSSTHAWGRYLNKGYECSGKNAFKKTNGFSIRCLSN
jgi:uncharacterized protein (TIGR02145 family)